VKVPFVIIGGGLSGIAAAIRFARFSPDVLILEKHSKVGGLNSYYYRNKRLFETGLHAITNYAPANEKHAPLNRLFRQLKISRKKFETHQQHCSEILFTGQQSLIFSNDFNFLIGDIGEKFPHCLDGFILMCKEVGNYDPFKVRPYRSARQFIYSFLKDNLLTDMLLCPLLYYGSSVENDIDLGQFVIMFRSIYQEGMFRPAGTIKDFLDFLCNHYQKLGGTIRLNSQVHKIIHEQGKVAGVELKNGDVIQCDHVLSTVGLSETFDLLGVKEPDNRAKRLGFIESIFLLQPTQTTTLPKDKTIIFFNSAKKFRYQRPHSAVDYDSGVICFPSHFQGCQDREQIEVRSTHLANYQEWKGFSRDKEMYKEQKQIAASSSSAVLEKIIGDFRDYIVFEDTFTPLTINKFTSKKEGAIYGSPVKVKDGNIGFANLFLAGTDQGFLGIIGSMLSGVSMVNQHILPKI
jgi:phytoene dehydrogenase-like protein